MQKTKPEVRFWVFCYGHYEGSVDARCSVDAIAKFNNSRNSKGWSARQAAPDSWKHTLEGICTHSDVDLIKKGKKYKVAWNVSNFYECVFDLDKKPVAYIKHSRHMRSTFNGTRWCYWDDCYSRPLVIIEKGEANGKQK